MFYRCKRCLVTNTRPRVTFINGICSGCINFDERKKINWKKRFLELKNICNKIRNNQGKFDVIVPVGGGKDSSYVAWSLKNKLNMNPLGVFCEPPLMTDLGKKNLTNFENAGFSVIRIAANNADRRINKLMLKKYGLPQYSWISAIKIAPIKIALAMNIKCIMWGEEGESMYGGLNKNRNKLKFDSKLIKKYYQENISIKKFFKDKDLIWQMLNKNEIKKSSKIYTCYWSYFEKWDENMHLDVAKKYCGLEEARVKEQNAINKHSHTDQKMFSLHMYLAYLKYGFSRATSDTSIDIRHKRISRRLGLKKVKQFDHVFPSEYLSDYCDYFNMTRTELIKNVMKFKNKSIFTKNYRKIFYK